jgi:hypothetical protein
MKKLMIIAAVLIIGIGYSTKSEAKTLNNPGFEFGLFYSKLTPYGTWIEINGGLVVWKPTIIHRGWAPYRQGRWLWTVDGWYWDSYEPFGYIVFHYGRWYYDDYYGWIWVPDYDWAPAWVEWRYDDVYIGWAPLPPYAIFSINLGIHYTYDYYVPYYQWHFVSYGHFCNPHVYNYYVAPKYKYRVYNRTKYRNNYDYRDGRIINGGVDIDYVRQRTGQNIRQRDIQRVSDYKEIEKYRGKDTEVIRTFAASRDELTKTRIKGDFNIERKNNRTTLDVTKVRLGRGDVEERKIEVMDKRRSDGRDYDPKREILIKEKNGNDFEIKRKNDSDVKENEKVRIEKRKENSDFIPERKVERKEVKISPNVETNREKEVKGKTTNRNNSFSQERNQNKIRVNSETKKQSNSNGTETPNRVERKNDNTRNNIRTR